MNREIKFKAKRLDNGEWVKGLPILYKIDGSYMWRECQQPIRIDPHTLCQYTGEKDMNGKEIWEGDVVEREIYDLYKGIAKVKGVIEYRGASFIVVSEGVPYSLYSKYVKVLHSKFDKEEGK